MILFLKRYKYFIILFFFSLLCVLYLFLNLFNTNTNVVIDSEKLLSNDVEVLENNDKDIIKVDIKGEVINPGVYEMSADDRVIDLINMAGGFSKKADSSIINLSKILKDEMVIYIYSFSETEEMKKGSVIEYIEKECVCPEIIKEVCVKDEIIDNIITNDSNESSKISINNASKEQLMSLSGIGESKAKAIIEYRKNNKFLSIDEIINVNGISESIYEKIKDYICL